MALPAQTSALRRVIVGVALLGVLVVAHLALQKANGFANGCTGFGDVAFTPGAIGGTEAGCATVTEGEYATFLGVSNLVWGALFYVLVVGLRLAYAAVGDDRLRLVSAGVVGVGLLYTGYLVYLQAAVIGSYCILCMASAALVLTLLALHVLEHRRLQTGRVAAPRRPAIANRSGLAALRPYVPLLGLFLVLLVADVGLASRAAEPAGGPVPPLGTQAAALPSTAGACSFDPGTERIEDLEPFTDGPFKGSADAPVRVVKVFDPNCPHCKDLSEVVEAAAAELGDRARFYYVAYPLRQSSLGQVVALKLAAREGRFFDLVEEMFARQDASWGMTLPELVSTVEAAGMSGAALQATLEDEARLQPLLAEIQSEAQAVQAAFQAPDGGMSVPKLAVEGNVVASTYASYSARCLAQFIAEAQPSGETAEAPAESEG
jgi:uncharacterized membrane protein/thiol-disulfide isomerase/thioredoxin